MLLDTNAFIWFVRGDARLKKSLREAIEDSSVAIKLSVASFWEMTIKHRIGKLPLPAPFSTDPTQAIQTWCGRAAIGLLPVAPEHVGHAMNLSFAQNDPFDRLIAATALVEKLELVTSDRRFLNCPGLRVLKA
ncbi:MAG TPA: type II toxin-antitoxin system VapC family toxin [Vitreimonas sp.]|uniref:type II toxin-antitoxin system VapC family toxin n=1 Tax=Vitreimonas sp. TaxID=3069702 RepID=UPI002D6F5784|nr:type II toxin-antitoxin system VapC family toxin [Vitreimonas sp.]HYD89780.1 type II toxin-antitoxin system VapC family toxin [Vitreimonas sp.]